MKLYYVIHKGETAAFCRNNPDQWVKLTIASEDEDIESDSGSLTPENREYMMEQCRRVHIAHDDVVHNSKPGALLGGITLYESVGDEPLEYYPLFWHNEKAYFVRGTLLIEVLTSHDDGWVQDITIYRML